MRLKHLALLSLLLLARTLTGQSYDSTYIVGTNLLPIISSQFNVFYEKPLNGYLTFHTGAGYVFNGPGSPHFLGTDIDLDKSSGGFISVGLNGHLKNRRISPLLGLRIVNSLSYEKGIIRSRSENFTSSGYSLGIGGILGATLRISNRLSFDLGIQQSRLLIDGLADYHSYAPGMGVEFFAARTQLIGQLKYRIYKY